MPALLPQLRSLKQCIPTLHDVDELRRLDCARYNACNDLALGRRWRSWACDVRCAVYTPEGDEARLYSVAGLLLLGQELEHAERRAHHLRHQLARGLAAMMRKFVELRARAH